MKPTDAPVTPFRARALALGLLLTVINAYWVGIASELWYAVYTLVSPFSNAIFTLAVLLGLNGLLKRWAPVAAFTPREMLLSYIMVTMVSTISGHAMMAIFMGTLAHPFWFASPENQYVELFARLIPQWLTVTDPLLLTGYFDGESSLYAGRHMRAWLVPVAFWSLFITAVYGSLLCVGLILRRQWAEREKLSFPLTHLPLQMTTNGTFWRSRALWIGIGIAGSVRLRACTIYSRSCPASRLTSGSIRSYGTAHGTRSATCPCRTTSPSWVWRTSCRSTLHSRAGSSFG